MVSWRRSKPVKKPDPGPVCQCRHGWCMHFASGTCASLYCSCQRYNGPEPLDLQVAADPETEEWAARKVRGNG
jgi:hypothetical protein